MKFAQITKDKKNRQNCIKYIANFGSLKKAEQSKFFNDYIAYLQTEFDLKQVEIEFDALLNKGKKTIFGNQNKPRTYLLNNKLYFAQDILKDENSLAEDLLAVAFGVGMFKSRTDNSPKQTKSIFNPTTIPLDKHPDPSFFRSLVEYMPETDAEKLYSYSLAKYVADGLQSETRKKSNSIVENLIKDALKQTNIKK